MNTTFDTYYISRNEPICYGDFVISTEFGLLKDGRNEIMAFNCQDEAEMNAIFYKDKTGNDAKVEIYRG